MSKSDGTGDDVTKAHQPGHLAQPRIGRALITVELPVAGGRGFADDQHIDFGRGRSLRAGRAVIKALDARRRFAQPLPLVPEIAHAKENPQRIAVAQHRASRRGDLKRQEQVKRHQQPQEPTRATAPSKQRSQQRDGRRQRADQRIEAVIGDPNEKEVGGEEQAKPPQRSKEKPRLGMRDQRHSAGANLVGREGVAFGVTPIFGLVPPALKQAQASLPSIGTGCNTKV